MKRLILLFLVITLTFTFAGCYVINIKAPEGKKIIISSKEVSVPDNSQKVFYLLWGLVPVTDNSPANILSKYSDESEVAITVKYDIIDYLVLAILGQLSIVSKTIEIEKIK